MKKLFIAIAAVALVFSASCTKVNPEEKKAEKISFQVANYAPATKANVSLTGETTEFKSKAYLYAEGMATQYPNGQDFFGANGETITFKSTIPEWSPSRDYFWPKGNSYINFVSWYDKNEASATAKAAVTETTITWTNRTIAPTDNIMWADEAWRYNQNVTTYKLDGQSEPVGVPTLFHHALAKLCIKAKADPVEEGTETNKTTWEVTLENIKINNTYNAGTLALTNSDKGSTGTKAYTGTGAENVPAWAPTGDAAGIEMNNTSVLTTTLAEVLGEQSVLPQSLGDDATITFTLHIVTKYNGTKYSEEKIAVSKVLNTLGSTPIKAWEMNTKYTYNITVNPKTTVVKFDPAVIDWVEDTNAPTVTL